MPDPDSGLPPVPLNAFQLRGYIDSYHLPPEDADVLAGWPEWDYSRPGIRYQAGTEAIRLYDLDYLPGATNTSVGTSLDALNPESHCGTMISCFRDLQRHFELNDHPDHGPIVVLLRPNAEVAQNGPLEGQRPALVLVAVLERELRGELGPEHIFRPNELQGDHPSLRAAIDAEGWPSTAELAGRFILILHDEGEGRDNYRERFGFGGAFAVHDDPVMFTLADGPDDPDGVFATLPAEATDQITAYAEAGLIVHVDVDMQTFEPAQQAGAHLFTAMELDEMPVNAVPASCNPVTGPMVRCTPDAYETPHPEMPRYPPGLLD